MPISFISLLISGDVLLALGFFVIAGAAESCIEHGLNRALDGNHAFHWSWEHLLAPLMRATIIVVFVLVAYPSLFGVQHAPPLTELLGRDALRFGNLLGMVFVVTLILPTFAVIYRHAELLMPAQGLIATAVVFDWFTDYLGATAASPWPGTGPAALLMLLILFGHRAALFSGRVLGKTLDRIVVNSAELAAQAPVILVYGYGLGIQLARLAGI